MIIHENDNVEVDLNGQKYALCDLKSGDTVIKYGFPIGHTVSDIKKGEFVNHENIKSNLSGLGKWHFDKDFPVAADFKNGTFMGYRRKNGNVGIRNDIWIVPTVGCAAGVAKKLAEKTGARALIHPHGCSQINEDLSRTQKVLCGLIKHPNAGGVLVLGLGCENNGIDEMKKVLGEYDSARVRFLNMQDADDEVAEGLEIISELKSIIKKDKREEIPLSELIIGVKCGGSDGLSGITANPLVGALSDELYSYGATILMTEVPECFGAEQILLDRSISRDVFDRTADMINNFRKFFTDHGEGIADNPSPGNMAGGISTLEEKSLGCVQKGGKVPLAGALNYGELPDASGLYLVNGPGNDQIAVTNLTAAGAHIIFFTTGRGTPLCAPVPTVKVSTNTHLYDKKRHWIDFNAGVLAEGADMKEVRKNLFNLCLEVASGKETRGEKEAYYDIAIFKDGVTL